MSKDGIPYEYWAVGDGRKNPPHWSATAKPVEPWLQYILNQFEVSISQEDAAAWQLNPRWSDGTLAYGIRWASPLQAAVLLLELRKLTRKKTATPTL